MIAGATTAFRSVVTLPVPDIATVVAAEEVTAPVTTLPVAAIVIPVRAALLPTVPRVNPVVALIVNVLDVASSPKLPSTLAAPVELMVVDKRPAPLSVTALEPNVPPETFITPAVAAFAYPTVAADALVTTPFPIIPKLAPEARLVIVIAPVERSEAKVVTPLKLERSVDERATPTARTSISSTFETAAAGRAAPVPDKVTLRVSKPAPPLIESAAVNVWGADADAST